MLKRYLKAQGMVLICGGLVGPVFLIVYFALGTMARPYLNWMFWTGLVVTAVDVLAALVLTNAGSDARHDQITRQPKHPGIQPAILDIVRRAAPPAPTVSERLQQLDMLHATGAITDDEYTTKRRDVLDQI